VDHAILLLREALALLDQEALIVPAAHVSLAIELIDPSPPVTDVVQL
jgi:hypothetical protein